MYFQNLHYANEWKSTLKSSENDKCMGKWKHDHIAQITHISCSKRKRKIISRLENLNLKNSYPIHKLGVECRGGGSKHFLKSGGARAPTQSQAPCLCQNKGGRAPVTAKIRGHMPGMPSLNLPLEWGWIKWIISSEKMLLRLRKYHLFQILNQVGPTQNYRYHT